MEYHPRDRRGVAPWVWVLIVLAAIILIFVVWWAVAAQPREDIVVLPPEEREPVAPPAEEPRVIERERPVNIYIERDQPRPNVIIIERDQTPPEPERFQQANVPTRFEFQGQTWEPTERTVTREDVELTQTGMRVDGSNVYAQQGDTAPYDELYIQAPGADAYIVYERTYDNRWQ